LSSVEINKKTVMKNAFALLVFLTLGTALSAQTNAGGSNAPAARHIRQITLSPTAKPAQTNLTIVTTNQVLISGTLVGGSDSNLVVSSFGMTITVPRDQIKWCETNLVSVVGNGATAAIVSPTPTTPPAPTKSSASVIAEFSKPHTEAEMRLLLQTPEAQALVKDIADAYIGAGTDSGTTTARESYLSMVQQFQSGGIGIAEIQGQAHDVLGELGKYDKELNNDPNAEEWKEYRDILQGFLTEPAPAAAPQVR
jgi:hypothetical protein